MSMDMPVKQWTKDVNDQETTEDKKLSEAKNKTWMSGASKTPVSAESLFTESGVTLSDLGFTLLNTDSSADINDQ